MDAARIDLRARPAATRSAASGRRASGGEELEARGRAARGRAGARRAAAGRGSCGASEAESVAREDRARRLVQEATDGRRDHAEALLALDPELAREGFDAALVLGDAERVRAALERDPGLATRPGGARDWLPLLYPCHSAFLGGERTDGLLACARALLDAGADPDSSWEHPEFGTLGALYGAAGVAHEPRMTALLLEAGANPDDDESVYHATETADDTCLRLLLDAGAKVEGTNAIAHCSTPSARRCCGCCSTTTPGHEVERSLLWAIYRGRSPEVIRMLVAAGADVHAWDEENERTPYGLAWRMGRPDLCEVLAELGARREVGPVDELIGLCFAGDRAGAQRLADAAPRPRRARAGGVLRGAASGGGGGPRRRRSRSCSSSASRSTCPARWAARRCTTARGGGTATSSTPCSRAERTRRAWPSPASAARRSGGPRTAPSTPPARSPRGGTDHVRIAQRLVQAGAEIEPDMIHEAAPELAEWLEVQAARGGTRERLRAVHRMREDRKGPPRSPRPESRRST